MSNALVTSKPAKPRRVDISSATLYHADALEVLPTLEPNSIDAIITDPPYFKVKDEPWDRAWDTPAGFLEYVGGLLKIFHPTLKPNGSLYFFASPAMTGRVEVKIRETFNVLNVIRWAKPYGWANGTRKEDLRAFFPAHESLIFAEHYGADSIAKGESGYEKKCDELKGFLFEPLRAYLKAEWEKAGLKAADANAACGTAAMARHYFARSQWALPIQKHYEAMRAYANRNGGDFLRREYEDLRREYEDLRRPFNAKPHLPYTDTWTFNPVLSYPGKHPCEKPLDLMTHILRISTVKGAAVLDPFMGSGTTGVACELLGRRFVGIEKEDRYFASACRRIGNIQGNLRFEEE